MSDLLIRRTADISPCGTWRMDDNVTPFPQPTLPEWILPPMDVRHVVLDGRLIPKLTAHKRDDGSVCLTLDGRYGLDCADEGIAYVTACFVANAMAIGAGFPCFTADDKFKPFAPRCSLLNGPDKGTVLMGNPVINPSNPSASSDHDYDDARIHAMALTLRGWLPGDLLLGTVERALREALKVTSEVPK